MVCEQTGHFAGLAADGKLIVALDQQRDIKPGRTDRTAVPAGRTGDAKLVFEYLDEQASRSAASS